MRGPADTRVMMERKNRNPISRTNKPLKEDGNFPHHGRRRIDAFHIRKPFLFVFISRPAAAAAARTKGITAAEGVIPQKSFISFFFYYSSPLDRRRS